MKALVFHRPKTVSVETVDDPRLEASTDVILKVTSTSIGGSDLHLYNGFLPQLQPLVLGREFMGVVQEAGRDVHGLHPGDRVVVPSAIACGQCFFCQHQLPAHCETSNPRHYGPEGATGAQLGGAVFGFPEPYGGYPGGQAEYVRVPFANVGPRKVPDGLTDEQVLFLSDLLPAGWAAVEWAGIQGGETVAVFGCGPVGLVTQKAAWLKGAKKVIALDREEYRLRKARDITGVDVVDVARADPVEAVRAATRGRGADVCIDAVGLEAHRTPFDKITNLVRGQSGSIAALRSCLSAVRRGGCVSVVGMYASPYDGFPLGQVCDKGVTVRGGRVHVHNYLDNLLDLIQAGDLRADDIITHRMPLLQAPLGYEIFNSKRDGCVKVVLRP